MWMSFTLTSRRHPSHKRLAEGPQELKPALDPSPVPASTGSLAVEAPPWHYSYFSGYRQAKVTAEMCPEWIRAGRTPKWATGCPLPTARSCYLSSVTLGAWWLSWEGWTSPGWGGGSSSPPLGSDG